ncbi:hypothetical protein [Streptomyces sp. NBC_00525]|uniref:hypothetical protein n=1 Tax=Streptomyces sp. NBC_00525 TaxID=2903660 RepID=UPI002E81DA2D|nr:hypothetical protein [Streptomyces sp. NBC_00525]WUC94437.1 hypothetical protein OG710_12940 [Streptomyces sp. NBC_00525]
MSTEPESRSVEITDSAVGKEAPLGSTDVDQPEPLATDADGTIFSVQNGNMHIPELVTGLGAAVTAASVVMKAKIDGRVEVRRAEIEAETNRLEITEETKREQMRLEAGQPAPEPADGD